MANLLLKRIKDWARSITAFRTGDVLPVDGPNGTAKMSKDNLLKSTFAYSKEQNYFATHQAVQAEENRAVAAEENLQQQISSTLPPVVIEGDVTNNPDNEDLTSVNNLLKFKDRISIDEKGYIILRRDKSFSEQVVVSNTIYEVRYPFDLNSEEISIPEGCLFYFNGGYLVNGVLSGVFKTVGEFYASNIGVNNSNTGAVNSSRLNLLSKVSNEITLNLDSDFNFSGIVELSSLTLIGHGCKISFGPGSGFDFTGNLFVKNCKLTNMSGYATNRAFQLVGESGVSSVRFEDCDFEGNLRIFNNIRYATDLGDGISSFELVRCKGEGNYCTSGSDTIFRLSDTLFGTVLVEDCDFHNFTAILLDCAITNGSVYYDYIANSRSERNIVLKTSSFHNDLGLTFTEREITSVSYFCVVVAEQGKFISDSCSYVNLLCELSGAAVYDNYACTSWIYYRNNYWKNCLNISEIAVDPDNYPSDGYNCFIKSKGAGGDSSTGTRRIYEGNTYVVDISPVTGEYFLQITGDNDPGDRDYTIISNNIFKAKYLHCNFYAPIRGLNVKISGNLFEIERLDAYGNAGLFVAYKNLEILDNKIKISSSNSTSNGTCCIVSCNDLPELKTLKIIGNDCDCSVDGILYTQNAGSDFVVGEVYNNKFKIVNSRTQSLFRKLGKKIKVFSNYITYSVTTYITDYNFAIDYFESIIDTSAAPCYVAGLFDNVENGTSKTFKFKLGVFGTDIYCYFYGVFSKDASGNKTGKLLTSLGQENQTSSSYKNPLKLGFPGNIDVRLNAFSGTLQINAKSKLIKLEISSVAGDKLPEFPKIATSSQRASWTDAYIGLEVFDTTLNIPVFWSGTKWLKSDGTDAD